MHRCTYKVFFWGVLSCVLLTERGHNWRVRELNAAELRAEMMCDGAADINSTNLPTRWTLIWMFGSGQCQSQRRLSVCIHWRDLLALFVNTTRTALVISPSSPTHWLIIDLCSNRASVFGPQLPLNAKRVIRPSSSHGSSPNPINEWEWVSSSADINLSFRHLSPIVCWWGASTRTGSLTEAVNTTQNQLHDGEWAVLLRKKLLKNNKVTHAEVLSTLYLISNFT